MRMHLTFENGSNPYYTFDMSKKKLDAEIRKWSKNWILCDEYWIGDIVCFTAIEKHKSANLFLCDLLDEEE